MNIKHRYSPLGSKWFLDKSMVFLNHGSFGACPKKVLTVQSNIRKEIEKQPLIFLERELEKHYDRTKKILAKFLKAPSHRDIAFIQNATAGVNTVISSLKNLNRGDEIIITNHEYNACKNSLARVAALKGAKIKTIALPTFLPSNFKWEETFLSHLTAKTRFVLLDHITSQTAQIFPVEKIIPILRKRNVEVMVDGAHAPGMLNLNLKKLIDLGLNYYTGNLHKWVCAPRGAAFLYVHPSRQQEIKPLITSHGANSLREDRSKFLLEFDWTGTHDPSAFLSVPYAIEFLEELFAGGFRSLLEHNHHLAIEARNLFLKEFSLDKPCPDDLIGSMATIALPKGKPLNKFVKEYDQLKNKLLFNYNIEIPISTFNNDSERLIRFSCQAYNDLSQYKYLIAALKKERVFVT